MNTNETDNSEVQDILKDLIEIARDGQEGYRLAAEHAHDSTLKLTFAERSASRGRFVSQLQQLQTRYGETDVREDGSISGALHRTWIDIKAAVTRREDQAILEEAERGEDAAVEAYRDALLHEPSLPADALSTVENQAAEVKKDHDYIRQLRDSGKFTGVTP